MPDTLLNIPLTQNEWVDLYAASGIAVGTQLLVENTGVCDVYLAVEATEPAKDSNSYNILKRNGDPLRNQPGDSGAWAFCQNTNGEVNVNPVISRGFAPALPSDASKLTDESGRVAMVSMTGEAHTGFKVDDISVNFQYGISTNDIVNGGVANGTGSIGTDGSMATVSSGIGIGDATLESRDAVRYRAGHECHCALSIVFGTPEAGVNQFAGFLNGEDAWSIGYQGTDFGLWFIEGGNVNFINQTDFNIDKLDGVGPSGYDIDPETGQLPRLTYTWHGFLDMLLEVRTSDGRWVPAHREVFVNSAVETHLENPNLPISVKIERTAGSGSDITIKTGSWRGGVIAGREEQNSSDRWFAFFSIGKSIGTGDTVRTHLITLRSKDTYQSKVNHILTQVKILISTNGANKDILLAAIPTVLLRANDPVFAGLLDAGYADINTLNSVVEQSKEPDTVDITGLTEDDYVDVALIQGLRTRENLDVMGFRIYPGDEISFVVVETEGGIGSGTASLQGNFKELH